MANKTSNDVVDRLPPYSLEAEQGVLGCILINSNLVAACIDALGWNAVEAMYDLRHQTIFQTMIEMWDKREAIDVITLQESLNRKQMLEEVGGVTYLSSLADVVPSSANLPSYLEIVMEKHQQRQVLKTCTEVVAKVYELEMSESLLDEAEKAILSIRKSRSKKRETMNQSVCKAIERIEDLHSRMGQLIGLGTGFTDLDKLTGGLMPGEMFVLAARPSMGKTSLAMNIVEHVAIDLGLPVGVFSLEMSRDSLVMRMLCSRARVNLRNIREGFLAERDFPKITHASGKLAKAPLIINDESGLSVLQLRAAARRMAVENGIKLVVVDYLQLLHATIGKRRVENRQQEIAEISNGIKSLAKELSVPIIVLSQMNRSLDRDKRKPVLADLRESGAIEQDADQVAFLYKPPREDDDDGNPDAISVNLLMAKQRSGQAGVDICLTFLKPYTRFENAARISSDDIDHGQMDLQQRNPHND